MMLLDHPTAAGDFRHRVRIIRRTTTVNEIGEATPGEQTGELKWAAVQTLSAEERLNGQQLLAEVTHRIRLRHTPNLTSQDAIELKAKRLAIRSLIDVDGAGREIEALCVGEGT